MDSTTLLLLFVALLLVVLNGFFVAAEFALVKVRGSQVDQLQADGRAFAGSAKFLANHLESSLSACQLGITMASLGLGYVAEPSIAKILTEGFHAVGVENENVIHTISFIIAFTTITTLHLVIGEQAPKIYAIRKPENMLIWCALPMRFFFYLSFPLMIALNWVTSVILGWLGLKGSDSHDTPLTEEELRLVITEAHLRGHVSRSEHSLIHAVFEFDDLVCRRIMVPRNDVDFLDVNRTVAETIEQARLTKHTRYPICDASMDEVLGVIHIKDLVGVSITDDFDWTSIMRPPKKVPENMPISKLLRHFQATHQLLAFVIDEYGNTIGIVTLENVLETIIGDVDDEFDVTKNDIVPLGPNEFDVAGSVAINVVENEIGISCDEAEAETFSGFLMEKVQRILAPGDVIELDGGRAEVLEARDDRAVRIKVTLKKKA